MIKKDVLYIVYNVIYSCDKYFVLLELSVLAEWICFHVNKNSEVGDVPTSPASFDRTLVNGRRGSRGQKTVLP